MFEMLQQMLKQMPLLKKWQEAMERAAASAVAEGEAGAGLVRVRANGLGRILSIEVDESLLRERDRETLEALLVAACNQALSEARARFATELPRHWDLGDAGSWFGSAGESGQADPQSRSSPAATEPGDSGKTRSQSTHQKD